MLLSLFPKKVGFLMIKMQQEIMQHDMDSNQYCEKSDKTGEKLDDKEFLSQLNFHDINAFKKVDYVKVVKDKVYLIEFTDLSNEIKDCIETTILLDIKSSDIAKFIKELRIDPKLIKKKLWVEVIEEIKGKFIGSIACYERMLRLIGKNEVLKYSVVVVLKNDTEPKYFDFLETYLKDRLKNLTGEIKLLRTQDL